MNVPKIYVYAFFSVLCILTCCSKTQTSDELILSSLQSESHKELSNYDAIIFVPATGCGGCISNAEQYLLHTYIPGKRSGILYVLTGHTSQKAAVARLGKDIVGHKDIYIDYKNKFGMPPFMHQYPIAFFLDSEEISKVVEINPETSDAIYKTLETI